MIDIYDEIGYIKDVLEKGISNKWERDVILLIRYYKMQGDKKAVAKEKIYQKCMNSNEFKYNKNTDYKRLNKIIDAAWKKDVPLRAIKQVEITKEVLDWFLTLEKECVISQKEVDELKEKRKNISIKTHPISWNRTKYLFTLYIWTKVQEQYLDKPQMHYLNKYNKRFKEDANLSLSFSMTKERNLLYDLGFIDINYALGINAIFIKNFKVFQIPITDDNRIIIAGEDLYKCGYWLQKQKMGSFICQNCGKEFAHYTTSYKERSRKYCKECAKFIDKRKETKYCIDCGKELVIDNIVQRRRKRCIECQIKHEAELRKKYYLEKKLKENLK